MADVDYGTSLETYRNGLLEELAAAKSFGHDEHVAAVEAELASLGAVEVPAEPVAVEVPEFETAVAPAADLETR